MKKILIVEDDIFLRELYTDILTEANYEVTTATNGDEALKKLENDDWTLVLLDVVLPKHSGFEVIETIQKKPDFKKKYPIIFFTNLENPDERAQAERLGDGYIVKSQLSPPEFLESIKKYLK